MIMNNFLERVRECAINFLQHSKTKNLEQIKRAKIKTT